MSCSLSHPSRRPFFFARVLVRVALSVAAIAAVVTCSATRSTLDDGGDSGSSNNASSGGDVGFSTTSAGGGSACATHCSADLHHVVDCDDKVLKTCPDDLGCSPDGTCVAPCDSAMANDSTIGCDFYSALPGPMFETRGSCFAALIANTWTTPVTISASHGSTTFNTDQIVRTPVGSGSAITYQPLPGGKLDPGKIAIVFLSQYPSGDIFFVPCPPGTASGINGNVEVNGNGLGNAFHLTTDRPIIAYDIFPYGGASSFVTSSTLLLPTQTWGDNFVAADAFAADPNLTGANGFPYVQIVAAEAGTTVTVNPKVAITGGPGVAPAGANQPTTYSLGAGQLLQFMQPDRLAGSIVASDKPISMWGGSSCMNIPIGNFACDSGHQQLLPVNSLGNTYLGVRYADRVPGANESVPYELVGMVPGTQLIYDPGPPAGAPNSVSTGDVILFYGNEPFVVRSQDEAHPFYLATHMSGAGSVSGNFENLGDPEVVNVIPPAQYLDHYLFLTDPTYRYTQLIFTRVKAKDGTFKDVTLDCLGPVGGWAPVGQSGEFEYARVNLVIGGAPVGGCDNGVHTADSESPFGLTVWGWDVTVSYGYPAGMSLKPINTVTVPPVPQ
ncbi:MAG: hypothetical protein EXR75_05415 [Myxococcales bacterium]|nr:hypothetical protein [Myxococcales bacterium]